MMERSSFIQAFQRQLDSELIRGQARSWGTNTPTWTNAERITLRDGTAVSLRDVELAAAAMRHYQSTRDPVCHSHSGGYAPSGPLWLG